jgi:alkylhydroperoxidase family enzyme
MFKATTAIVSLLFVVCICAFCQRVTTPLAAQLKSSPLFF